MLTHEEERQVATELKGIMEIKSDLEKILTYVKRRHRYGTTAGCFNILAMEQENRGSIQYNKCKILKKDKFCALVNKGS